MLLSRFAGGMLAVGVMLMGAGGVSGQAYPNKPLRIVTSEPGGANDVIARLVAQGISGPLGQPVIVENRVPVIAIDTVAKAPPEGYTLIVAASTFWIGPLLVKTSYDPVRDFSPISITNRAPNVLVVNPSSPVKSVKELIALAKARPGELNYGSTGAGSSSHLAGELFKVMAGVNIVRIAYKGSAPALIALIAGDLHLMFPAAGGVGPHVKSGKLRALAVSSAEPSALVPGLPTIAASGVPGYESGASYAMFAPAKTPVPIINRLNQEIVRVLNREDVKEKLFSLGTEVVGNSPQQLAVVMKSEMTRMGKLIRDAGIKAE